MKTSIRKGSSPFYGDQSFSHGISRSGYFNKRESDELMLYGKTFAGLSQGTLTPENDEEIRFVGDMQTSDESSLYPVRLWKKYLDAVEKSRVRHGFSKSQGRTPENTDGFGSFI
ncbi:DUF413 domain-containing protein [Thalassomonas actiniarum]|uniref:Macrodomain Ori protein n=1 Tax=Thalassomonas actiniarum TaxID=485447 RepID=A0AAE9YL43_9GAMM|nr:DUF413 domain-containing protein [Thalassomonas actiniarum]WDD97460.1 DUF413 domain-containing protein [Thalassomonas actiniarum]